MNYSKDFLIKIFKDLLEIRFTEESFVAPILDKTILCPVHLYSGEEAIAVGVSTNLKKKDMVFGTHRSHGHYLAKGGSIEKLVAEVYCKESGVCKGRGGSMHLIEPEIGFLGSAPIVAGTISLALGAALASHIKKQDNIAVAFFGDGAAGEGVLYESINFASIHKLPLLFVCENNYYSTHMHIKEIRNSETIFQTAEAFDIKAVKEDGNDVLKVYETSKKIIEEIRNGSGPAFIEFSTYRFRGHVGPDDNIQGSHTDIRPQEEIDEWHKKDPIIILEQFFKEKSILDDKELNDIKNDIQDRVKKAHDLAIKDKFPDPKDLRLNVFDEKRTKIFLSN